MGKKKAARKAARPAMKPERPLLFVGSSQEARKKKIVDTFLNILGEEAHCIPWWFDPRFKEDGSTTTFSALCSAATEYDFAVFILTGDDVTESRDNTFVAPRDNVVFELGLFMGAIGPDRVMAYVHSDDYDYDFKTPSDFSGVGMPRFEHDGTAKSIASVRDACDGFCTNIRKQSFRKIDLVLAKKWYFDSAKREFVVVLCPARITRVRTTIGNYRVSIAARLENPDVNIQDDTNVAYSEIRTLPDVVNDEIPLRISETRFKRSILPGDTIQGRVLLIPEPLKFDDTATLSTAVKARCREVETMSYELGKDKQSL